MDFQNIRAGELEKFKPTMSLRNCSSNQAKFTNQQRNITKTLETKRSDYLETELGERRKVFEKVGRFLRAATHLLLDH